VGTDGQGIKSAHSSYAHYWLMKMCPLAYTVVTKEEFVDLNAVANGAVRQIDAVISDFTTRWRSMADYIQAHLAVAQQASPWVLAAAPNPLRESHVEVISFGDYGPGTARAPGACLSKGSALAAATSLVLDNGAGHIKPLPRVGERFVLKGDLGTEYLIRSVDNTTDSDTASSITFAPGLASAVADNEDVFLLGPRLVETLVTEDAYTAPDGTVAGVPMPVHPRAGGLVGNPEPRRLAGKGAVWVRSPDGVDEVVHITEV